MVDHLLVKVLGNLAGKVDSVIDDFPCSQWLEIGFRTRHDELALISITGFIFPPVPCIGQKRIPDQY